MIQIKALAKNGQISAEASITSSVIHALKGAAIEN